MSKSSDLTGEQSALLELVVQCAGQARPQARSDLRRMVDAMLYFRPTPVASGAT